VLGSYLNLEPQDVPLSADARGKPHVAAEANAGDLRFSLSHCDRRAVLAVVVGCEIGVDLQEAPPDDSWAAIAERFFTLAEKEHLHALSPAARAPAFAEIWTRKEAAGKALGEGLTSRIFSIAVGPASWGMVGCGEGFWVWSLPSPDWFATAIALREPV
jgi:4'-phosphopantetheinyl transferase